MTISWVGEGLPTNFILSSGATKRRSYWADDTPEVGAARRRKRFSRSLRSWPEIESIPMDLAFIEAFETFYETTTDSGQEVFEFPAPKRFANGDIETVTVRFIAEPEINPLSNQLWQVKFGVEEV